MTISAASNSSPKLLEPIVRGWGRVDIELSDSEAAAFHSLLYLGELLVKLVAASFVGAVQPDIERKAEAAGARLVRAAGVGDHVSVINDVLVGPTFELLHPAFKAFQSQFVAKNPAGSEEALCLDSLREAMRELGLTPGEQAPSSSFRAWFHWFVHIRNKTRGHGAPASEKLAAAYPHMRSSIELLTRHIDLFRLPWAYVRRNLSGKYRVIPMGGDGGSSMFSELKAGERTVDSDGVYLAAGGRLFLLDLVHSDADLSDFYVPNGCFSNGKAEFISLITGDTKTVDVTRYAATVTIAPPSETDGKRELDVVGRSFTNMPPRPVNFVERRSLGEELRRVLMEGRNEIVSLSGPGGAGKTTLALEICHQVAISGQDRFLQIIWFSARDIDLVPSGPKTVKPQGLLLRDFARSYVELVAPPQRTDKAFKAEEFFARELAGSETGATLFVFDNFETVSDPAELFRWIDVNIRSPNKALITTRTREFSGDKPLSVRGMEDSEAKALIDLTARSIGISSMLTGPRIGEIIQESGGHPYVIKIMLGEMASRGAYVQPERVVVEDERLLDALFERTYAKLSPAAQFIFLVLSSWRSAVPLLAVQSVLLYHLEDRVPAIDAVDELIRLSMADTFRYPDGVEFLSVPLAAAAFGKRKRSTSSQRALVDKCVESLQMFGATQLHGASLSSEQICERFVRNVQRQIETSKVQFSDVRSLLEGAAASVPVVWRMASELLAQVEPSNFSLRIEYLKRYIENSRSTGGVVEAWGELAKLLGFIGDIEGQVLAYGEIAQHKKCSLGEASHAANQLNNALRSKDWDSGRLSVASKRATIEKVVRRLMEEYAALSATDLSRLAWLFLNSGNENEARRHAEEGLRKDSSNDYCLRLVEKLNTASRLAR